MRLILVTRRRSSGPPREVNAAGDLPKHRACLLLKAGGDEATGNHRQNRMQHDRDPRGDARRFRGVQLVALAVLAGGALAGGVLWAKWGFSIAFDAVIQYCF